MFRVGRSPVNNVGKAVRHYPNSVQCKNGRGGQRVSWDIDDVKFIRSTLNRAPGGAASTENKYSNFDLTKLLKTIEQFRGY